MKILNVVYVCILNVYSLSLTIMVFVNFGGGGYWFFEHSKWNGGFLLFNMEDNPNKNPLKLL